MTAPPPSDLGRISALDGLRGWAALSVIVYHLTWELFGGIFTIYRNQYISFFGNGAFAVAVFFAISGYVLTIGRWRRRDNPPLWLTLIRRYLRLEIPILSVVVVTYVLMSLNLTPTSAAAVINHSKSWMATFANFSANPLGALWYSFINVFGRPRGENYVPFLWTMMVELWGSLLVLTLSQWSLRWAIPYLVLIAVAVALFFIFPQAIPFPLGALVALAQRDGWLFARAPTPLESFIASAGVVVVLLCAAAFQVTFAWQVPDLIAGFALFVCVMRSLPARAVLSTRASQLLGRLSFPLYLVQYPVIISLGAWAIVALNGAHALNEWTSVGVAVALFVIIVAASFAFLPVEIFTLKLIRRIGGKRRSRAGTAASLPQP